MMAAMSTLRSLCMVKVHQLNFPTSHLTAKYLPAILARDVAKARLFQGNYILQGQGFWGHARVALTISYDGENWIFSHRSQIYPILCCEACDVLRPDLFMVTMQEDVAHPTSILESPYIPTLEWMRPQGLGPDVKLSVQMEKKGSHGKLTFKGSGFSKSFEVSCQEQGKTLTISNIGDDCLAFQQLRSLTSVDVTAELAFPEPQNCICSNPNPDYDSEDFFDNESSWFSSDSDWGVYEDEESDGH